MANIAIQWSGLLLISGAALLGTAIVMTAFNPVMGQVLSPPIGLLMLLASAALLLALPAMYARHAEAAGWLGLAGHALLQIGILLLVVLAATPLVYPSFKEATGEGVLAFLLGIALTLGLLLTGAATLLAGVYPQGAGIALLAATAGFFFVFFIAEFLPPRTGQIGSAFFGIMLAFALAWMGLFMLSG